MQRSEAPFIHFSSPGKVNRANRRKIASYIGRNYRNRSRPSTRPEGGISMSFYKGPQSELRECNSVSIVDTSQTHENEDKDLNVEAECNARSQATFAVWKHKTVAQRAKVFVHNDGHSFWFDPFESLPISPKGNVAQMISYCGCGIFSLLERLLTSSNPQYLCSSSPHTARLRLPCGRKCRNSKLLSLCFAASRAFRCSPVGLTMSHLCTQQPWHDWRCTGSPLLWGWDF